MDYETMRAGMARLIPFNTHLGLETVELGPTRGVARLPEDDRLVNHVGSQHAGGLFSVAEWASGLALLGTFAEQLAEVTPLAESAEISYGKIARGPITATGRFGADRDDALAELEREGRVRFPVKVDLTNEAGESVAEVTVRWYVRKNS
jgi:acyl-coenzyme A thioesterase PaaI-like protein